ncbi:uncharacterized protein KIAA0825-like isoform X2 [Lineus longissimus]|uniref:uncharacterized protein KIAA0825-like isoform X2 n=1 Tax=Lineus longissimus TaxID=88925 RepID=UPI002B4EF5C1
MAYQGEMVSDLCLRTILEDGVPSPQSLEELMRKLDVQLGFNRRQLERVVNDIVNDVNNLPGNRVFTTATDAIEHMSEHHILEKTSCFDPDPEDVTRLLKHVLSVLEKCPGSEETTLQSLLQLSSEEGIILPIRSSTADQVTESMMSINTVTDSSEQLNESLWGEICMRLRRSFIDGLNKLPINIQQTAINLDKDRRLDYLQSLCSLYPSDDIWARYKGLRCQQVDRCIGNLLMPHGRSLDLPTFADNFEELANVIIVMIDEDFIILNSGIFKRNVKPFQALHEIFQDKLSDEISAVMDNIIDELIITQNGSRQSYHAHSSGLMSNLKSGISHVSRKGASKSLDSLLIKSEDMGTELILPASHVHALTTIISATYAVDCHVETLYQRMTWEVFGNQKKKNLKSSLKATGQTPTPPDLSRRRPSLRSSETTALLPDAIPPPFGATLAMMAEGGSSNLRVIEKAFHEDKPPWQWKELFVKLVPDIARAMEKIIRETSSAALEDEWQEILNNHELKTEELCEIMMGGKLDYPRVILKSIARTFQEIDELVPLAAIGSETCFHLLRTTFVECTTQQMKNFYARLNKICDQVPQKLPMNGFYIALASAAFIRNHLLHFDTVLTVEEGSKKLFLTLYRQFCDLVDTISRQIVEYHNGLLANSFLQDADSHHWEDSKEFYDDQSCSLSILMWNLHMKATQHDLWQFGPPRLAQSMFAAIIQESLLVMAQRYCRVKPAYRRTRQFRCDILSILLCASQLLLPGSNTSSRMMDASSEQTTHFSIHNSCTSLVAAMAIVVSPLEFLYKTFKKGFSKKRIGNEEREGVHGKPTDWLALIWPHLFQAGFSDLDDMQTTSALYLQLKLFSVQPEPNFPMMLQALLMKDFTLPIMILTQPMGKLKRVRSQASSPSKSCGMACCLGEQCHSITKRQAENLFVPFVTILIKCSCSPDALGKVLLSVIGRSGDWGLFEANSMPGKNSDIPLWLDAIHEALVPFINRVMTPALQIILKQPAPKMDPLWNYLHELPCGCKPLNIGDWSKSKYATPPQHAEQASREMVDNALKALLTQIFEEVYCIPTALCTFFQLVQDKLRELELPNAHHSVGLLVIGNLLRMKLSDYTYVEAVTGQPVRPASKDNLLMLADCAYTVLAQFTKCKGTGTPRLANSFVRYHRQWLQEKMDILLDYFWRPQFAVPETKILDGATADFREQYLIPVASSILETSEGHRSLIQIYNLLQNNMTWLLGQLDVPPLLGSRGETTEVGEFHVNMEQPPICGFNPIKQASKIGNEPFNHEAIGNFNINWQSLLQSDLGLSEIGFRTLLFNRHEMQEGAYLEEVEKKPVHVLKMRYDVESAEIT